MKTIKQMYLAMTEHGVVISDDVTYLENGVYLVKDTTTVLVYLVPFLTAISASSMNQPYPAGKAGSQSSVS